MKKSFIAACIRLLTGVRQAPDPGPGDPRRIYYANHSSHLDAVVIWSALPPRLRNKARPVAAADYWSKTAFHRWLALHIFRAVLIPRHQLKRNDDPIGTMTDCLAAGDDLILFPEGTRSLDGKVGKFHSGLHALGLARPDVQLIPVYLDNLNHMLPKGEFLMLPLMCSATFGAPCPGPKKDESRRDFLDRARATLIELSRHHIDPLQNDHEA